MAMPPLVRRMTLLLFLSLIAFEVRADDIKVGAKVVTVYVVPLKDGDKVVDDGSTFRVYQVEKLDGDQALIASGDTRGWVEVKEIVPYDRAEEILTEAIQEEPDNAEARVWRGLVRMERGEYGKAIADYDEAIRLEPGRAAFHAKRGHARHMLRDQDGALADYSETLKIDPNYPSIYENRAMIRASRGQHDEAITDLNEAIRLDPRSFTAYSKRGNSRDMKGDIDGAIADYSEAIRLAPGDFRSRECRAYAQFGKREFVAALVDYEVMIRINLDYALAYKMRAWIWAACPIAEIRDGRRAIESATKACQLDSWKSAADLDALAAALAESGDFPAAIRRAQQSIELTDPKDEESLTNRHEFLELYRDKKPYRLP